MKKLILLVVISVCLTGTAFAQRTTDHRSFGEYLERQYAQQEVALLKSYYTDRSTAKMCEAWYSCAKWAFEQYEQDQSFKIIKTELKKQRKVYRHRVTKETHLFVQASYTNRTVYLEFITPKGSGRTAPYRYLTKFPQ